ncbi:MAG TPA: hypothetical protein VL882_02975 [Vicinamibacterales bacterium]|nr:hypothetical protein [Vicinamibacterales bacterium]
MTDTLRHTVAGIVVLGVWGWLPNQAFAQTTPVRMMRVLVLNTAGAPVAVLSEAEKAAARVFQAAGIETTWRQAGTGTVDDDLTSMIIINLMSASMEARMKAPATVMGFAVSGARLASIMYGRVERLAQANATDLATVLGHVIAHEIGHLLLPPGGHSAGGIMNAMLDLHLAVRGVLQFSSTEVTAMRARIAALARSRDGEASNQIRDQLE